MNVKKLKVIDLFAGAGGFSLGLQDTNKYEIIAYNDSHKNAIKTYRENLNSEKNKIEWDCNVEELVKDFSLVKKEIKEHVSPDIDLIVGGPPCQGFSMIGRRRNGEYVDHRDPNIFLYQYMIEFIAKLNPRAFIFENVQGLLYYKDSQGNKGGYFRDIIKQFKSAGEGYSIDISIMNAYEAGIPQNRPRIIMVGILESENLNRHTGNEECVRLHSKIENEKIITYDDLKDPKSRIFLPREESIDLNEIPTVVDAIGDLELAVYGEEHEVYSGAREGWYRKKLRIPEDRIYVKNHKISNHRETTIERFKRILENGGEIPDSLKHENKFSQRVLPREWPNGGIPNITITSMPDDYIHYSRPSSLSVRECARLQSFPDSYVFKGNRTTGGLRRAGDPTSDDYKRDLPQYTQVGNAVPPFLAEYIGNFLYGIIC